MTEPLPVNELFDTIQGEGHWTGTPATFIRLQGCDVGCPWCDTKHTWEVYEHDSVAVLTMMGKIGDHQSWASMCVDELCEMIAGRKPRHVVITGGEPAQYDLIELTGRIIDTGKTVQIETSGTYPIRVDIRTSITVSPKVGMPGGRKVLDECLGQAHEIKMPVGKFQDVQDVDDLIARLLHLGGGPPQVWLQPLSTSKKATALCVQAATERGWRVSIQTHKFAGLR